MSRKKLQMNSIFPYHVMNRSNNFEWFKINSHDCWNIFSECLFFIAKAFEVKIHAFTLMSNHFHLMLSTPHANLDEVMNRFLTNISFYINENAKRKNHVFGGRYKGCLIDDPFYYANCLKYIYRNPVNAKLADRVEEYPYSSLYGLLGQSAMVFPVLPCLLFEEKSLILDDLENQLEWLNTDFKKAHAITIQSVLRRTYFKTSKKRSSEENYLLSKILC